MDILAENTENVKTIAIAGRLDATNSTQADEQIAGILKDGEENVALDLSRLEYISSAGLRVMLLTAKRIAASKLKIAIFGMTPGVKEVFDISGFSTIFKIFDDGVSAAAYLKE